MRTRYYKRLVDFPRFICKRVNDSLIVEHEECRHDPEAGHNQACAAMFTLLARRRLCAKQADFHHGGGHVSVNLSDCRKL
jgi:hypothetical protein